jgi:phosphatidylglycerol:prolipoprotein diacylglycerol transferase
MLIHPNFDPVALHWGPLLIRWYGLMYLLGFGMVWWFGRLRMRTNPSNSWTLKGLEDVLFYGILGVVIGGRLGYVIFYKLTDYIQAPLKIFYVWEGGMSFHGGFLGVLVALMWFAHQHKKHWMDITDFIAPMVPLGLAAGRLGNFINAELWGRVTDVPWAMIFPQVDRQPRHPSQLYQLALEGLLLFFILWWFSAKPRPRAAVSALFLIGYGGFRFIAEYFREPDGYLGLLMMNWSMGQWLSWPMVVAGVLMMRWAYRNKPSQVG